MDPTLLASLLSKGPSLLEGLTGLFTPQRDPAQEAQRNIQMLLRFFNPNLLTNQANSLYGALKSSPMYTSAIGNLSSGAQQSANILRRNLADSGISGSGIGQISNSLAPSVFAGQLTGLNSGLYSSSLDTVRQMISSLMQGGLGINGRSPDPFNLGRLASGISNTNWSWLLPKK